MTAPSDQLPRVSIDATAKPSDLAAANGDRETNAKTVNLSSDASDEERTKSDVFVRAIKGEVDDQPSTQLPNRESDKADRRLDSESAANQPHGSWHHLHLFEGSMDF